MDTEGKKITARKETWKRSGLYGMYDKNLGSRYTKIILEFYNLFVEHGFNMRGTFHETVTKADVIKFGLELMARNKLLVQKIVREEGRRKRELIELCDGCDDLTCVGGDGI